MLEEEKNFRYAIFSCYCGTILMTIRDLCKNIFDISETILGPNRVYKPLIVIIKCLNHNLQIWLR